MIKKIAGITTLATVGFLAPNLENFNSEAIIINEDFLIEEVTISTAEIKIGDEEFDLDQGSLQLREYTKLEVFVCHTSGSHDYPGLDDEYFWADIHDEYISTSTPEFIISRNNINDVSSLSTKGLRGTDREIDDECNFSNLGEMTETERFVTKYSQTGTINSSSQNLRSTSFSGGFVKNGENTSVSSTHKKYVYLKEIDMDTEANMNEDVTGKLIFENDYNFNISSMRIDGILYPIIDEEIIFPGSDTPGVKDYIINTIRIEGVEHPLDRKISIDFSQTESIEIDNDGYLENIGFDKSLVEPLGDYTLETYVNISHDFKPKQIEVDGEYQDVKYMETLNGFKIMLDLNMPNLTGEKIHVIGDILFQNSNSGFQDYSYLEINQNLEITSSINIENHVLLNSVETDKSDYSYGDSIKVTLNLDNANNNKATAVVINNRTYQVPNTNDYSKLEISIDNLEEINAFELNIQKIVFEIDYNEQTYTTDLNVDYSKEISFTSPVDLSTTRITNIYIQDSFEYDETVKFKIYFSNEFNYDIDSISTNINYPVKLNKLSPVELEVEIDLENQVGIIHLNLESITFATTHNNKRYTRALETDFDLSFNVLNYDHSKDVVLGNIQYQGDYYENIDTYIEIEILENPFFNKFGELTINNKVREYDIVDDFIIVNLGKLSPGKNDVIINSIEIINFNDEVALKEMMLLKQVEVHTAKEYLVSESTGIEATLFYITLELFAPIWNLISIAWFQYTLIATAGVITIYMIYAEVKKSLYKHEVLKNAN